MTGIYGNSQEDKYRERELDRYLDERDRKESAADDEAEADAAAESAAEDEKVLASTRNYRFPEYLSVNANFVQLIKFMSVRDISHFVYHVSIIADEKEELDTRHFATDKLNAFLNELLNRGEL